MKSGQVVKSFSIPLRQRWILEELKKIAQREKVSFSRIVREACKEFIQKHAVGNPQTQLFPDAHIHPYHNPVTNQRRDNLEALYQTLKETGPTTLSHAEALFSKVLGVKRSTVKDYIRVLHALGQIRFKGNKVTAV